MNIQYSHNENVVIITDRVWINGEELPPIPTKRKTHCTTQINSKVYIDGYEFKKGKWKRTLKALWHLWF